MTPTIDRPSAASLLIQMEVRSQPLAIGTAFLVQRDKDVCLVTNRHNLTGRRADNAKPLSSTGATPDAVTIRHNRKAALGSWTPRTERLLDSSGKPLWIEHPTFGRHVDVVALPLTQTDDVAVYLYDLWATELDLSLRVANDLSIVGFPFGMTGGGALAIWSRGTVASEPDLDFEGLPLFLIDSRTRPGQSGSPVIFFTRGGPIQQADGSITIVGGTFEQLVGVYSGRVNEQSDLGFVWKVTAVRQIIEAGKRPL